MQDALSHYEVYFHIISSFEYRVKEKHEENLLRFEKHLNSKIPEVSDYEKIDLELLKTLENAPNDFIEQLNYPADIKTIIYLILNEVFDLASVDRNDEKKYQFFSSMFELHQEGLGDDGKLNDRRTIAFAYGSQYNFKRAVLYAGAIQLSRFKHSER